MNQLLDFAKKDLENLLTPFGKIDVLLFYGIVAGKLRKYLHGKELASKIWMPGGNIPYLIKRGSKLKPVFVEDFADAITPEFLEIRSKFEHISQAEGLTDLQKNIWNYFLPRKLADFFYATNNESPGKPIDRIFFDIDRGKNISAGDAQEVAKLLVKTIEDDGQLENVLGRTEPFVCWTGKSFHVLIFLDKPQPSSFYEKHFQYSKKEPEKSFTGKWAKEIAEASGLKVAGGHEKSEGVINIDPSQTPSGKLCRVPLGSLHMKDAKTIDGVSIPLTKEMLGDPKLTDKLKIYQPKDVIKNLEDLAGRLPEKFK
jgi:hypothetical protein